MIMRVPIPVSKEDLVWATAYILRKCPDITLRKKQILDFLREQYRMCGADDFLKGTDWEVSLEDYIPVAEEYVKKTWPRIT